MAEEKKDYAKVLSPSVKFKQSHRGQALMFPPLIDELIPLNHPVRLVDELVDEMDLKELLLTYKSGGASSYPAREMLKLLIYGCVDRSYSVRVLEQQCQENVCYMWLMGGLQPDHGTIHHFRRHKLGKDVKVVFAELLKTVFKEGYVRLKTQMTDGTIIESVANRYTYVWFKNIDRYKGNLDQKIDQMIEEINRRVEAADQEEEKAKASVEAVVKDEVDQEREAEESKQMMSSDDVLAFIEEQSKSEDPDIQRSLKQLAGKLVPKLKEYEKHLEILDGRNSYSKTDPDATFMRQKKDFGKKEATPLPSYNLMISTEDQFIINYTIHQNSNDGRNYKSHTIDTLEMLESQQLPTFIRAHGDAAFGTGENYEFIENLGIENYLKHQDYHRKNKAKLSDHPSEVANLHYNEAKDFYVCPMGQQMTRQQDSHGKTATGHEHTYANYQAKNCDQCPLRGSCFKAEGNRIIRVNQKLKKHRAQAEQNLNSLQGIRLRSKRSVDVEPVFGHIKYDRRFSRTTMWGKEGAETMIGLISIAHNIKKIWNKRQSAGTPTPTCQNMPPKTAKQAIKNAKTGQFPLRQPTPPLILAIGYERSHRMTA